MSKSDPYFQFPVSMLRDATDTQNLTQTIASYSLWHYGLTLENSVGESPVDNLADEYIENHPGLRQLAADSSEQRVLLAAANRLRVDLVDVESALQAAMEAHSEYGTSGRHVRIRSDYLFTARHNDWPLLKLQVLCGVIAGIGDKGYAKLTLRMIQAIGAGYNSPRDCAESALLSKTSVHRWLEQLWLSNLFQRCSSKKDYWYSISHQSDKNLAISVRRRGEKSPQKKRVDINDVFPH